MKISQKGIDLIKSFEGFRSEAYICPGGVLTIGYGHTKNVKDGDTITKAAAEKLLYEDVEYYAESVSKHITSAINQDQFDALVSLCYNIGPTRFFNSPVRRIVNENPREYARIEKAFHQHIRGGGEILPGLVRRREEEFNLYCSKL